MSDIVFKRTDNQIDLSGELTADTVSEAVFASMLQNMSDVELNFSEVSRVDTAGLAWIILLFKQAKQKNINVKLINCPDALTNLAKLSDVDKLLGLQ